MVRFNVHFVFATVIASMLFACNPFSSLLICISEENIKKSL